MALDQQSKWGSIIAGAGLLFICIATLTPGTPPSPDEVAAVCRGWCDDSTVADFARNIVLFLPMAFGLRLAGVRTWKVILLGSCLSATVELLQLRIIVGRDSSVLDWISNTIGTISGALIANSWGTLLRPQPRLAVRLLIVSTTIWIGVLLLGAWGIQPAPGELAYWGERAPRLNRFAPFLGELVSARVNGIELPSARMVSDDTIRSGLHAGELHVDAIVRPGPRPNSSIIAPIARIADSGQREILMLGRGGHELVFRMRLRATTLRLETPAFALAHAFRGTAKVTPESLETVQTLTASLSDGRVQLMTRGAHETVARQFELSPAVAWSFFLPWDYWFGPNAAWISLVWLAALSIPVGYWAAIVARGRERRLVVLWAVIVTGSVEVIPLLFALPPTRASAFFAVTLGVAIGWLFSMLIVHANHRTTAIASDSILLTEP